MKQGNNFNYDAYMSHKGRYVSWYALTDRKSDARVPTFYLLSKPKFATQIKASN